MIDVKISVGITLYTNPDYIMDSINSLIAQSENSWEGILVLDKGADKKTTSIFNKFTHPNFIKYECKKHRGPEQAKAKAIELSNAEWYFQLDSDDILPNDALINILRIIKENPKADFICGSTLHFSKKSSLKIKPSNDEEQLAISPLFSAIMPIKISMYNKIGGFSKDLTYVADWDFWLSVYEHKIKGASTNKILYKRRQHYNNVGIREIGKWSEVVKKIIDRHPIYFNSKKRKNKALYNVYEKSARYYRQKMNRSKAAYFSREALMVGKKTSTLLEILKEEKMSKIRYILRVLGRLI